MTTDYSLTKEKIIMATVTKTQRTSTFNTNFVKILLLYMRNVRNAFKINNKEIIHDTGKISIDIAKANTITRNVSIPTSIPIFMR